ncbi:DUF262 domain-containing protein [bacterium D16-51]|nr:DUF262 domain-containing protein [bacterium D16-59]RKI60576.1 DUF262 domain-containing protein [bacterium D16-51]
MLSEKQMAELNALVNIAKDNGNKLNSMLFYNVIVAMPGESKQEDIIFEMQDYLFSQGIEIISEDVEIENEEIGIRFEDVKPFNPSRIDIVMRPITLDSIVKRIKNEEINMETAFQRKSGLWNEVQKSQLIESLLLKIPLPAFYFDESKEDSWLIIDGLQRLTALKEFIVDKTLKLKGLEFFSDLDGIGFDDLPRAFIRRIEETNLIAFNIREGTPENVKFNIFKRINTGGLELSFQEIRHAIFFGKSVSILKKLSTETEFKETTSKSIKSDRMQDQEFVLRYIAVCHYGIDKFQTTSEEFLNDTMKYLNGIDDRQVDEIDIHFQNVMRNARAILEKHAFRKIARDGMRRPINKAIYESWCYCLGNCSDLELAVLIKNKQEVQKAFCLLCEDSEFQAALKHSRKRDFNYRVSCVKELIEKEITVVKKDIS